MALATYLRRQGDAIDLLHVEVAYPTGVAVTLAAVVSGWRGPIVITPMGEDTIIVDSASYGYRRHLVPRGLVAWTLRRAAFIRSISPVGLEFRIRSLNRGLGHQCVAPEF